MNLFRDFSSGVETGEHLKLCHTVSKTGEADVVTIRTTFVVHIMEWIFIRNYSLLSGSTPTNTSELRPELAGGATALLFAVIITVTARGAVSAFAATSLA